MGSYYYLYDKECPYCSKIVDEIIFAENSYDKNGEPQDYSTSRCEHCGKPIKVWLEIKIGKLEDEKE